MLLQVVECERRIESLSEEDQAEKDTCDRLTAESKELMATNESISAALEGSGKRLAEQQHTLARWAAKVSPFLKALVGSQSPPLRLTGQIARLSIGRSVVVHVCDW